MRTPKKEFRCLAGITILICLIVLLTGCESQENKIEERNKAIVTQVYVEGINAHDVESLGKMLADDYVRHSQSSPTEMQEIRDKEIFLAFVQQHFTVFPDWNERVNFLVAEGDMVAVSTTGVGTHKGQMGEIAPTNKQVTLEHLGVHRINEDGKIAETWVLWDNVAFLSQLGLYPPSVESEGR